MNLKHALTALLFATGCVSFIRAQEPIANSDVKTYEIKGSYGTPIYEGKVEHRETEKEYEYSLKGTYGTLIYDGIVSRIDRGKDFEYSIPELKLEFDPDGRTNPTQRIDLKAIRLVATVKPADGKGRSSILYREDSAAAAVLTEDSPTATIRDLRFTVSKEIVTKADYLGFSAVEREIHLADEDANHCREGAAKSEDCRLGRDG